MSTEGFSIGSSAGVATYRGDDENAVVDVLIDDYAGQDYSFIVKIAFPHSNS